MSIFETPIKPEWFYADADRKKKINWFCYEVALEYYSFIMKSKTLSKYRRQHKEKNIAEFCAHFAKEMKNSVLDQLSGKTDVVIIDEEYIAGFYPKNTQKENLLLMQVSFEAWDSLLAVCGTCPSRCLSEKDEMSPFFDKYEY
jgi:uncharacterized Fe-S radical SAM superfamily protein PflX